MTKRSPIAISLEPNHAANYNNRGFAYNGKGEYDRAIADFDRAIGMDPKYAHAYSNRGFAYGQKGDFDRAMADLNKAIELNPRYARGYINRAAILLLHGDRDQAIADYQTAMNLAPDLPGPDMGRVRAVLAALSNPVTQSIPTTSASDIAQPAAVLDRRVALVIGNSAYHAVPILPGPQRDAKAVADGLREARFDTVEIALDLDRDGMVKALRSFRAQADSADWALVYFAGHGVEIDGINYLIPTDAKLLDDRDVKDETVSYESVLSAIGGAKALRLVVLDACRVNPFKDRMLRTVATRSPTDRGLARPPESKPGTLVVYSAKDGEVAIDSVDGVNSPFARAFVAQLKVPGREVRRLFDYVRDEVLEATGHRQQPFTYGSLPGKRDFFFVAGK